MKIELKQFQISETKLDSLPLFYNYIIYNDFVQLDENIEECISYSDKLNCYIDHVRPVKIISKFIDFSKE